MGRTLRERLVLFRNRLVKNPAFRSVAEKLPIFRRIGNNSATDLLSLMSGYVHSQVVFACVESGLLEALDGRVASLEFIASHLSLPEKQARALVDSAAAVGLLERIGDARYALGQLGAATLNNPGVIAMIYHHQALYKDLTDPLALLHGTTDERHLQDYWAYARSDAPESLATGDVKDYSALMAASQDMIADQVLAAVSLRDARRIMDVGGGTGAFLIRALTRWPHLKATLVDLPAVADLAREAVAEAGLSDRLEVVGMDATSGADLPGGHDVLSFVRILHDHDDDVVARLLRAARGALADGTQLIVAEPMAGASRAGRVIDAYFSMYLMAMGQGRPRRFDELGAMVRQAGFTRVSRVRTATPLVCSVLSAT